MGAIITKRDEITMSTIKLDLKWRLLLDIAVYVAYQLLNKVIKDDSIFIEWNNTASITWREPRHIFVLFAQVHRLIFQKDDV